MKYVFGRARYVFTGMKIIRRRVTKCELVASARSSLATTATGSLSTNKLEKLNKLNKILRADACKRGNVSDQAKRL